MKQNNTKVARWWRATANGGATAISNLCLNSTPRMYICQINGGVL